MTGRRLRVMQSFRAPRPTTNPYITQLDAALAATPEVEHLRFSWARAILGRYDVFHWHWPEGKLEGTTWWKAYGKLALTSLIVLRHRLSRVVVVRTVHNLELPDVDAVRRRLLTRIDAWTDYRIVLNATTPVPPGAPHALIRHGHYRDWYGTHPQAERTPGRLGYFGGIRRYKAVGALLAAYREALAVDPTLTLRIGGRPSSPELAQSMSDEVADLPGVGLTLGFLSDAELVELATSSTLVVLAYRFMHNSGSVLAALSLDRPVLVPRNEANEALAAEVGGDWVLMYDGTLDGAQLLAALKQASDLSPDARPDLSRREWHDAGVAHARAYRAAVAARRTAPAGDGR